MDGREEAVDRLDVGVEELERARAEREATAAATAEEVAAFRRGQRLEPVRISDLDGPDRRR